ncbi:MAG: hypothetical protein Q8N18_10505 [Opitutaceae bacterium]|nr:hypothetical protein [Opitutaceae bacterium]
MPKPVAFLRPHAVATLAAVCAVAWPGCSKSPPPAPRPAAAAAQSPAPAQEDPLAKALTLDDPRERAIRLGGELQRTLARDPAAAVQFLRTMPRGRDFTQALFAVLTFIGARDPAAALKLAAELARSPEEQAFYSLFFDRLAGENPRVAVDQLALVPAGTARENAIRALATAWNRTDPAAVMDWAQSLADPGERSAAVETAIGDLAARDPQLAIEIARRFMRPPALERTIYSALMRLVLSDPEAASALVPLLPPGDLQTTAAAHVARSLAERSVPAALAWVKTIPIDLTRWIAFNHVLTSWVLRDRTAAARHVLELPPGQGTEFAASHLAAYLADDPADAILWAGALPDEGARLGAYAVIASSWSQRAPAEAVRWAASLNEDPLRPNALGGAFSNWLLIDADAAIKWLETTKIPPAIKAKLLRRP